MVAREKLTEEEVKQLRKDIKDGKINIDDLYDKYRIFEPDMIDYKMEKQENPNLTIEQYNEDVLDTKINFLFWQMGLEGLDLDIE